MENWMWIRFTSWVFFFMQDANIQALLASEADVITVVSKVIENTSLSS
jgi:hypothetical protein